MKTLRYITLFSVVIASLVFVKCKDEDDNVIINATCSDGILNGEETGIDCGGPDCVPCGQVLDFSGTYVQEDQMGRPAINVIFGTPGFRDAFNVTVPSQMQSNFQSKFEANLLNLNPAYTTNILGQNAEAFTTFLSKDVLWLAQNGPTTYYNGTAVLTGRALADDVMDTTLLWIFGGPDGTENPGLTNDGVPENDAAFSNSFPYLAAPF